MAVLAIAVVLVLVPMVPAANFSESTCVFCPTNYGVDYASITYAYLGFGAYHTVWGSFGFEL